MKSSSSLIAAAVGTSAFFFCTGVYAAETPALTPEKFERLAPVEPADVAKTFRTQDGFKMELLAAEPLVTDPVAMVYDENGLAYVVEMNDYPYTDKKSHEPWKENKTDKPIGKIRLLEDTNDDGKFDKSYVFAEELSWPSGIVCWKGGVFVTATPDIWYLKDTDGDHKADVREKVFTGFRKYNVQAVINNPIWGLDNKIYAAGSGNGGNIVPGDKADSKPVALSRNDFRFDPVTEKFEPISGGARFGNTIDDWGNRFICNIRNPAQHIVLDNHYLARNPYLPVQSVIYDIAKAGDTLPVYRISPVEPWREARAKRWSSDGTKTPRSELTGGGVFTSASGITIYRGAAYPEKFRGNAFLGEVANNVIYRQTVSRDGVTFKAQRADDKVEFVQCTDTWFRPVNFVNAPDGTFHVLDMYRETIEHPWSIPDDIHALVDLESGRDRGRIYRLEPPNFRVPKSPRLGKATTAELVATLENPSSWWRETAQRLIFERQDKTAIEPLQNLLAKGSSPLGRLHALWSLEGLGALRDQDILLALNDASPGVRENAVKLGETRLEKSQPILTKVLELAEDSDIRVRFQVALSIGGLDDKRIAPALFGIFKKDPNDRWIRTAVSSATPTRIPALTIEALRDERTVTEPPGLELLYQLTYVLGAQAKVDPLYAILNQYYMVQYCHCFVQQKFWGGMGDGLRQVNKNLRSVFPNTNSYGALKVNYVMEVAKGMAENDKEFLNKRVEAVYLLGFEDFDRAKPTFAKLLNPSEPQELQIAAVKSLSGFKNPEVASMLLEPWRSYTPATREEVLNALLARRERLKPFLDAVEQGTVAPTQVNATRRSALMANTDLKIREQATKLFGQNISASRKDAVEKYKTALSLQGDKANGIKVFEANCMACHRLGDKGTELGPNLETVKQWDAEKILLNILDPNREVAPNFMSYEVELKDGTALTGLIAEETANAITLKRAESAQETVLRQNIAKISSSGMSLMPDGLEANIQPQDMADLLAFLLAK